MTEAQERHQRLVARLTPPDDYPGTSNAVRALRAVVELHLPDRDTRIPFCEACQVTDNVTPTWPCETIETIANHLGWG